MIISSPTSKTRLRCYFESMRESILIFAIKSSSKAMRRVSLGARYIALLTQTIDILRTIEGKERTIESGMSLLHASIVHCLPAEVTNHLLETGCREDLELVSGIHGHTPLQAAMRLDRPETFLVLLKHGADINRRLRFPEDITCVQFCAHVGPRAIFYAVQLVSRGVQQDPRDDSVLDPKSPSHLNPAHYALSMGNFELAAFFDRLISYKHGRPSSREVLVLLIRFFPRLPVSRLILYFRTTGWNQGRKFRRVQISKNVLSQHCRPSVSGRARITIQLPVPPRVEQD